MATELLIDAADLVSSGVASCRSVCHFFRHRENAGEAGDAVTCTIRVV
jgi:hypothetical protein